MKSVLLISVLLSMASHVIASESLKSKALSIVLTPLEKELNMDCINEDPELTKSQEKSRTTRLVCTKNDSFYAYSKTKITKFPLTNGKVLIAKSQKLNFTLAEEQNPISTNELINSVQNAYEMNCELTNLKSKLLRAKKKSVYVCNDDSNENNLIVKIVEQKMFFNQNQVSVKELEIKFYGVDKFAVEL